LYVGITCPHCKVEFKQIPEELISTNKASACKEHLRVCHAAMELGIHTSPAKRKRLDQQVPPTEPSDQTRSSGEDAPSQIQSLQTQVSRTEGLLCQEKEKNTTLVCNNGELTSQNTQLASHNGELKARVSDLEAQMSELRVENTKKLDAVEQMREGMELMRKDMQDMREELAQLRPLAPLVQRITNELGMVASVPPAAPVDVYVEKIDGLRKAAALGGAGLCDKASKKSKEAEKAKQKEIEAMKRVVDEKEKQLRSAEPCIRFWDMFSDMFVDPAESEALLKKISVHSHPDKNPGITHAAQGLQKGLNELRRQVAEARG